MLGGAKDERESIEGAVRRTTRSEGDRDGPGARKGKKHGERNENWRRGKDAK